MNSFKNQKKLTISVDTETELISAGVLAPRMVCLSWCYYCSLAEDYVSGVLHYSDPATKKTLQIWLTQAAYHDEVKLVGHNVAYDMAVIASQFPDLLVLIFQAYAAGNIDDTLIRQQLIDIADGTFWKYRKTKGAYSLLGLFRRNTTEAEQ